MLKCKPSKDRSVFAEVKMLEIKGVFCVCLDVCCLIIGEF